MIIITFFVLCGYLLGNVVLQCFFVLEWHGTPPPVKYEIYIYLNQDEATRQVINSQWFYIIIIKYILYTN